MNNKSTDSLESPLLSFKTTVSYEDLELNHCYEGDCAKHSPSAAGFL